MSYFITAVNVWLHTQPLVTGFEGTVEFLHQSELGCGGQIFLNNLFDCVRIFMYSNYTQKHRSVNNQKEEAKKIEVLKVVSGTRLLRM